MCGGQRRRQLGARPVQARAHGADRTPDDRRGIGIAHLLQFAEHDDLAIRRRESGDRRSHRVDRFRPRQAVEHASSLGDPYLARALLELGDQLFDSDITGAEHAYRDAHAATEGASLDVIRVDEARQLLMIRGAIPGSKGGFVTVRPAVKAKPQAAEGAK